MTLQETIRQIEIIASHQPSINMVVENDVFRLNSKPDARYGVFAWVQGQHTTSIDANSVSFVFTFFYVDRLKADKSNQIEIQSVGIQSLDNIIRQLDSMGISAMANYSFTTFNQRFLDDCAGVFCNVTLDVPAGNLCHEDFADFNDDFNEDFLIY